MNKGPKKTHPAVAPATDCREQPLLFADLGAREVVVEFTDGEISSDGGVLLLCQVDHGLGLSRALALCFHDARDARYVDHSVPQLVAQRLYGQALGYVVASHSWRSDARPGSGLGGAGMAELYPSRLWLGEEDGAAGCDWKWQSTGRLALALALNLYPERSEIRKQD